MTPLYRSMPGCGGSRDTGNVTVLSLGFAIVSILVVLVVSAATAVHLDRLRATRLADDIAVAAADALDLDRFYAAELDAPSGDAAVMLDADRLAQEAQEALELLAPHYGIEQARLIAAISPDGFTVVVTIEVISVPIFPIAVLAPWSDGITLIATSSARAY